MADRRCPCGSGLIGSAVNDGYGIFLFYGCNECYNEKLKKFRPDILELYQCDEPIEEE